MTNLSKYLISILERAESMSTINMSNEVFESVDETEMSSRTVSVDKISTITGKKGCIYLKFPFIISTLIPTFY